MKITPMDIQQKRFSTRWRGLDVVEVDQFLDLLSKEFEELMKENEQLREGIQKKASRILELESQERKVIDGLASIQQIIDQIKTNAQKEGELIMEGARADARKIIENARAQALQIENDIQKLIHQREQFKASFRANIEMYRNLLEAQELPSEPSLPFHKDE